jgi:WD40 repeat protein
VRIWDPTIEAQTHALHGHDGPVNAICSLTQNGTRLVATGGSDGTIRTWNATTGTQHLSRYDPKSSFRYDAYGPVLSMCAFTDDNAALLAAVYDDRAVHIWNPSRGSHHALSGEDDDVRSVCTFTQDGAPLLATANGASGTVRIWGTAKRDRSRAFDVEKVVNAICAFTYDNRTLLAAGGPDGSILIAEPPPGIRFRGRQKFDQSDFLVSIYEESLDRFNGHGSINAICAFSLDEATFLATANNHTICVWNLTINSYYRTLYGHEDIVNSVCPVILSGTTFLATGSSDRSVRIWDPTKKANAVVIPTRDEALCVACADETLFVGTTTGVIAIRLDPAFLRRSLQ